MDAYQELIQFQNESLKKYGPRVKMDCFGFLFTHVEIISRCIIIMNTTVDPVALNLALRCLEYIDNLLQWRDYWITANDTSFKIIMVKNTNQI